MNTPKTSRTPIRIHRKRTEELTQLIANGKLFAIRRHGDRYWLETSRTCHQIIQGNSFAELAQLCQELKLPMQERHCSWRSCSKIYNPYAEGAHYIFCAACAERLDSTIEREEPARVTGPDIIKSRMRNLREERANFRHDLKEHELSARLCRDELDRIDEQLEEWAEGLELAEQEEAERAPGTRNALQEAAAADLIERNESALDAELEAAESDANCCPTVTRNATDPNALDFHLPNSPATPEEKTTAARHAIALGRLARHPEQLNELGDGITEEEASTLLTAFARSLSRSGAADLAELITPGNLQGAMESYALASLAECEFSTEENSADELLSFLTEVALNWLTEALAPTQQGGCFAAQAMPRTREERSELAGRFAVRFAHELEGARARALFEQEDCPRCPSCGSAAAPDPERGPAAAICFTCGPLAIEGGAA